MKAPASTDNYLKGLDYSVVQQCMHCGMCLPTCPTYDATLLERHSPRGRIALMRAVADEKIGITKAFADEMYFCLGCLACQTACPAGVNYTELFEMSRAEIERQKVLSNPVRNLVRGLTIKTLFMHPRRLRLLGRLMWLYQASGLQWMVRRSGLLRLAPKILRELEPLTPTVNDHFSDALIAPVESPRNGKKYRVGLLTGCVQDLVFSDVNRDTADVLLANGCEVVTPREQFCCGSLHGHNGEWELAKALARKQIDAFKPSELDAIITNSGGCGSHLKHYDHLLADDPHYAEAAREWSRKVRDISQWLAETGIVPPKESAYLPGDVTYHESCHLCHGQKISSQPRQLLKAIPGLNLRELPEATWCCGSAGVYNITQPEMSMQLLDRKMKHIKSTGACVVASGNPGCNVQLRAGAAARGEHLEIAHPVTLLARAYRKSGQV
ncbi:MAG: (Fe-S)-binding protein [Verrucomicrobiae bacterium]|nr:(Fe-S)-binding protein [Verrucomicrobiae bacterium]